MLTLMGTAWKEEWRDPERWSNLSLPNPGPSHSAVGLPHKFRTAGQVVSMGVLSEISQLHSRQQ